MKTLCFLSLVVATLLVGCSDNGSKTAQTTQATNTAVPTMDSGNPLNAPANYLGALAKGRETAIKTVDIASLDQAAQMFNVQEGRYPKDLNELVASKLIVRIPEAPYGMKLDYDPNTGKVKVIKAE